MHIEPRPGRYLAIVLGLTASYSGFSVAVAAKQSFVDTPSKGVFCSTIDPSPDYITQLGLALNFTSAVLYAGLWVRFHWGSSSAPHSSSASKNGWLLWKEINIIV
jgi:hypothetical protein